MTKRRVTTFLLAAVLFLLGIYLGCRFSHFFGLGGARRTYDTPVLLQQVQTLSDLVTVKYIVQKVEVWEDPPSGLIGPYVQGNNRLLLLAQGVVKAGVDLGKLKPEDLKVQGKTIWIKLPPAHITDAYLDDNETKVIERTTGFLRKFDKDLEQNVRRAAVQDIRSSAGRGGILHDAEERARTQLANFFTLMGFEKVEFELSPGPLPGWGAEEMRVLGDTNAIQDRTVPQIHSP
jgi:hypothetical protein